MLRVPHRVGDGAHTIFPFSSAKELAAAPDGRERFELLYMEIQYLCKPMDQDQQKLTQALETELRLHHRCHNSFLVNMAHIRQIDRRVLALDQGGQIPVGRNYYETAQAKFIRFLSTR